MGKLTARTAISAAALADLEKICPGAIFQNVELSKLSRWKIGGIADLVIQPETPSQVKGLRSYFFRNDIKHTIIGLTSNLLFADEGLKVPCIQIGSRMGKVTFLHNLVQVQAGAWVPGFSRKMQQAGFSGAEHICGIPGTIGGLVCMNGGTQRKGIESSIVNVTSVNLVGEECIREVKDCEFSYRRSVFQKNGEVIVQVSLKFEDGCSPSAIRSQMLKILKDRRRKFPQREPNCGSVFKSNPDMYAAIGPPGAVIERLGFKGLSYGGAIISHKHANFIINSGGATAIDVLRLISEIKSAVKRETGYLMEAEACYVDPNGTIQPADNFMLN